MQVEEFKGRTVSQALARLREHSQIEASQEAQEAAEPIEEATESAEPRPATGGAQEGAQRPWWRRVLGR